MLQFILRPIATSRNAYCVECQKKGKQKIAKWICLECTTGSEQEILLCEKYELSIFPSGEFVGKPEDAFIVSADAYLNA